MYGWRSSIRILHSWHFVLLLIVSSALTFSCRSNPATDPIYQVISETTLTAGAAVPPPQEEVILTIHGKVGIANRENKIEMDRPTIEAVGKIAYTVDDPFEERQIRYTGVLMANLLDLWQIDKTATTLHLTALNDYHTEIAISELREYPVMLALEADGQYMQPDYRGPAMIVYPIHHYEFHVSEVRAKWIWQLQTIEVQ